MNKVISLFMKFTIGLLIVVSTFTTAFAQQSSHFTYLCLPEGSVVPYSDVKAIAFHFNPKTKSMTGYTSVKVTDTKQPNTPSDIRTLGLYKLDPIRNIGPEQLWEEYLRLTNYLGTVLDMDDKTYAKYHLRIEPTKFISDSYIYKLNGATSKIDPDLLPKNLQTTLLKGSIERYTFHYAMKRNDLNNGAPIINMQFYLSYSLLSIEQQKGATNYFELTCERQYPHEEELAIQEAFTKQWQKKKSGGEKN